MSTQTHPRKNPRKIFETANGAIGGAELKGLTVRKYSSTEHKNPLDWRHGNHSLLIPIGKDIFRSTMTYTEIAEKWGTTRYTISQLAKRLFPKNMERVRLSKHQYEWREKKELMKIKLDLNIQDRAWSASELVMALARTINKLDGNSGSGEILDRNGHNIGTWEVEAK